MHRALAQPGVLARLLTFLDWPALHPLLCASRDCRALFAVPALRHLILSRFVPGYGSCRHLVVEDTLLPIDLHQLHLFLMSQCVPVHAYPTHALRSLFSIDHPTQLEPLVAFSQAHSRLVLLLQSIVHSAQNLIIPPESPPALFSSPSVLELSSPAPLSYKQPPTPHPSRTPLFKSQRSTRRLAKAIFKSLPSTPLPPPLADPPALRSYSSTWRRSSRYFSSDPQSDSDNELVPPRRRYFASTSTSTNSQTSLSRTSTPTPPTTNSSPSPPPSRIRVPLSPLSTPTPHDLIHALSPSRAPVLRTYVPCSAPSQHPDTIIRCEEQLIDADLWTHLSTGDIVVNLGHVPLSDEPEVKVSEKRLSSNRIPPKSSSSPSSFSANWLVFNGSILVPFTSSRGAAIPVPDALTLPSPFYYTHILPSLANPIFTLRRMPRFSTTLPLASHSGIHHELPEEIDIAMRLVRLPTRVSISHGNASGNGGGSGVAVVRRYKWLARVFVVDSPSEAWADHSDDSEPEMGLGWRGEWVLEGDGTKEGREALVDYLVGRGRRQGAGAGRGVSRQDDSEVEWEWELVRERCRKGRLWFKLLDVRALKGGLGVEDLVGL